MRAVDSMTHYQINQKYHIKQWVKNLWVRVPVASVEEPCFVGKLYSVRSLAGQEAK